MKPTKQDALLKIKFGIQILKRGIIEYLGLYSYPDIK
jgi:hypothetical protein